MEARQSKSDKDRFLKEIDGSLPYLGKSHRTTKFIKTVLENRARFGITRVGSVTRLDTTGVSVVQVVRPLARSNSVCQGKGLTLAAATASALMEALETWAAERASAAFGNSFPASATCERIIETYRPYLRGPLSSLWPNLAIAWMEGWDLRSRSFTLVPKQLVDADYTYSQEPCCFPRTTTGLAGGTTLTDAIVHGFLEIIERHEIAKLKATSPYLDAFKVDIDSITSVEIRTLVSRLRSSNLAIALWRAPVRHCFPVYWCNIIENDKAYPIAPLPAEGFGCDGSEFGAITKAVLEACQARLTAISGAREDITRHIYSLSSHRDMISALRSSIARNGMLNIRDINREKSTNELDVSVLLMTLVGLGAGSPSIVPLYIRDDLGIFIIRAIAAPLITD